MLNALTSIKKAPMLWGFVFSLLCIAFFARVIPHIPNISMLPALCLFIGAKSSSRFSSLIILLIMFLSDMGLHFFYGYPMVGSWTFFTYTGFLFTLYSGEFLREKASLKRYASIILMTTLIYWLWTNLGVWLFSGLYDHSFTGFSLCYILALPFLRNSLFSNLLWTSVIFGAFNVLVHVGRKSQLSSRPW